MRALLTLILAPVLAPILAGLLAAAAAAGPWPRAPGDFFLSTGAGVEDMPRGRAAFVESYVEYGLRDRLTLGATLRHRAGRRSVDLFARWHPELPGPLALGLTLGARLGGEDGRRAAPMVALHLGHGAETARGNLWARVDLQAVGNRHGLRGRAEIEISTQFGLRTGWGGLAMLTLSDHRARDARTLKLTPAVGYAVTSRATLLLGATLLPRARRLDGAQATVWFDF